MNNASPRPAADKPFYVGAQTWTYAEVDAYCRRMAGWAKTNGLAPGDVVLVALSEADVASLTVIALLRNGLVAAMAEPASTAAEALQMTTQATPVAAIVDRALIERWQLGRQLALRVVVGVGDASPPTLAARLLRGLRTSAKNAAMAWLGEGPGQQPGEVCDAAPAYIVFTSGTTAQAKGIVVSHGALASHLETLCRHFGHDEDSRILNVLPLSHADGLVQGPLLAQHCGGTLYRPLQFSPNAVDALLAAVYAQRITHFIAVPTMLSMVLRLASRELDHVFRGGDFRAVTSAAAHLDETLWRRFEERYGVTVANLYGLTETVTGSVFSGPGAETRKVGTLGKPVDCRVRVVDAEANDLADGEVGELLIAGRHLMSGYVNDAAATRAVLRDGWLHTGDLAWRDADGFLHYAGRRKSLIISGGLNVQPEEVVTVLAAHPAVADVAVVGEADPDLGEVAVAVVVLQGETDATALAAHCRRSLSEFKVPRRFVFVEHIPRGRSGKVIVGEVKALLSAPAAAVGDDAEASLLGIAAETFRLPVGALDLESTPANTPGWDSLAHLVLAASIEKAFAITLSASEIVGIASLDDALRLVAAKRQGG